jgi:DNA-binding NarL/FixJ family response regulator
VVNAVVELHSPCRFCGDPDGGWPQESFEDWLNRVVAQTVVIGCADAARIAALTRAVRARSRVFVSATWPLEGAIDEGRARDTAVVVLDGYPSGVALRAMAEVTNSRPELDVLVLGPIEPDAEVLIALACGASGYLPSRSTVVEIADAVDVLLAGDTLVPRAVSLALIQHLRSGGRGIIVTGPDGRTAELTNREWEVLVLLRQELSTAEIARRLVVSKVTVRTHVAALVHKFGVRDRRALAVSANAGEDTRRAPHAIDPAPPRGSLSRGKSRHALVRRPVSERDMSGGRLRKVT